MRHPRSVVELLQDLVSIPSVNPAGDPGVQSTGELEIAHYVADFLRNCGAGVELREVAPGRPNVVGRFPSRRPGPRLTFAPHLDTVSVAGMTIPPFDPVIRGGRLFGRGSTDAKGPMAAALWALSDWSRSGAPFDSNVEWSVLGLINEEAGGTGAQAVAASEFESDLVMVLEPTNMAVVTAQKGVVWLEVVTQGRACHASTPEAGSSAIQKMSKILRVLHTETIPQLAERTNPEHGCTTLVVGTIVGGSKINIVPDCCRIEVDCRCLPECDLAELKSTIEGALKRVVPDAQVNTLRQAAPLLTSRSVPWVKRLALEAKGFSSSSWSSDAGVLSAPHRPSVCIGPGDVAQAHIADESMSVADLETAASFFLYWIRAAQSTADGV